MKKFIIDRFEGDYAICEDQETEDMVDILIKELPEDAKEGDIIIEEDGKYITGHEETKSRKEEIAELMHSLFNKGNNNDNQEEAESEVEDNQFYEDNNHDDIDNDDDE